MYKPRDPERAMYIYHARKVDKRTFVDIGRELGITTERVRQIYRRTDWTINRENSDGHRRYLEHIERMISETSEN